MATKVLIVEDELMAQKSLIRVLAKHYPDMDVIGTTTSVKGTVAWLEDPANKPDIIFMDVELSDGVCFEIFRQTEVKAKVIMTTAYDSYALKAFEAGSVDYLLKPIEPEYLKRAVSRCQSRSGNVDLDAIMKVLGNATADSKKEYKEKMKNYVYPSVSYEIADAITKATGREVRVTVPGHTQRGGAPDPYDRVFATRIGAEAGKLILKKEFGFMVGYKNRELVKVPLAEVAGKLKTVDPKASIIKEAKLVGISFGD